MFYNTFNWYTFPCLLSEDVYCQETRSLKITLSQCNGSVLHAVRTKKGQQKGTRKHTLHCHRIYSLHVLCNIKSILMRQYVQSCTHYVHENHTTPIICITHVVKNSRMACWCDMFKTIRVLASLQLWSLQFSMTPKRQLGSIHTRQVTCVKFHSRMHTAIRTTFLPTTFDKWRIWCVLHLQHFQPLFLM